MSEAAIRQTIYDTVRVIDNIGISHDYERFCDLWEDYLSLFKADIKGVEQIRGFTVGFNGTLPAVVVDMGGDYARPYRFIVRFYQGLSDQDESEKTAAGLVEDIINALDVSDTLHDGGTYYETTLAQCDVFEPRIFGTVLCHYAEIHVVVSEVI